MPTDQRKQRIHEVLSARQPDLTVVLDRVHKPHNLSAIMRTCDAVGVTQVHAVPISGDPLEIHRKASAGVGKWVDVVTHDSLDGAIRFLRAQGFSLWAAHPIDDAVAHTDVDYTQPSAIVMGSELAGLDSASLGLFDGSIAIPMHGMGQSLNVSVAAALILFEAERQRREQGLYDAPRLSPHQFASLTTKWHENPNPWAPGGDS